jgi:pimeloyl-ACP methyl ester carboxylesterase
VIGGGADVAVPRQQSEWLHGEIDGSRLEIIEDAGHLSNVDRPEEFNRVVDDFLSTL